MGQESVSFVMFERLDIFKSKNIVHFVCFLSSCSEFSDLLQFIKLEQFSYVTEHLYGDLYLFRCLMEKLYFLLVNLVRMRHVVILS